jgi:hypothetical protein
MHKSSGVALIQTGVMAQRLDFAVRSNQTAHSPFF